VNRAETASETENKKKKNKKGSHQGPKTLES